MRKLFNDLIEPSSSQQQQQSEQMSSEQGGGSPLRQKARSTKQWGEFNYTFALRAQGECLYQTSILYAEAKTKDQAT